jgi:HK97 family phage portal protein
MEIDLSVFGKIKEYLIRALGVNDPKAWSRSFWNLYGSQSLSGEYVDESSALTYSAFYNAISLISGTIGALPLHLMQRKGKAKRMADNRFLYRVMHDQWNPLMTAMAGREALTAHVLAWGNGYAEIVRNGLGEIVQLWPITPDKVIVSMEGADLIYIIRVGNEDIRLPRSKVLHIPGLGFDGFMGYSVVNMAQKSLGLGMALETFGSLYFGQGTHPGLVVSHPGQLSAVGHSNLEGSLVKEYSGLGKSHRLLLLEEGMKIEKIGIPPEDSQFLESRQFQIPEVARWFNLPPHKLKDLTKSSFSNIESEQISFVRDSILPWLVRFEQNYNMQLLGDSDKDLSGRGRLYFKHIVEGLLRGDSTSRSAYYSAMLDRGVFSINEVRELEDMDPIKGGDIHLVPLNMTTVEEAGKPKEPLMLPPKPNGDGTDVDTDNPDDANTRRSNQ